MLVTRSQQNSSFIVRFVIAQPCIIQSCILALFLYSTDKSKCSHTVTEAADHLTHASATAAPEWVTIACFSSFTVQLTLNSMTVPRSNHWFAVLLSCGKVSKMSLDLSRKNCFQQRKEIKPAQNITVLQSRWSEDGRPTIISPSHANETHEAVTNRTSCHWMWFNAGRRRKWRNLGLCGAVYTVFQKRRTANSWRYLCQFLTDF